MQRRRFVKNYQGSQGNQNMAVAQVMGSNSYPMINGNVKFVQTNKGVMVTAEISGLPHMDGVCSGRVFAFHIHEGTSCTGNAADPFANAKMHYNPNQCPHPYHAGDMPPLFENKGYAYMSFLTDRFTVNDIIGRTVIIHSGVDDFTTQPSGGSGEKIACGKIIGM